MDALASRLLSTGTGTEGVVGAEADVVVDVLEVEELELVGVLVAALELFVVVVVAVVELLVDVVDEFDGDEVVGVAVGAGALTVNTAALLVTDPALLVTTTV
jgi:hypothetical protein